MTKKMKFSDVVDLIDGFNSVASSTIKLTEIGTCSPDIAFRHDQARFPGLILEVSNSQKTKDLPGLAEDYFFGSCGNIRMMVGLDIDYRKSKRARVLTWQLKNIIKDGEIVCEMQRINNSVRKGSTIQDSS